MKILLSLIVFIILSLAYVYRPISDSDTRLKSQYFDRESASFSNMSSIHMHTLWEMIQKRNEVPIERAEWPEWVDVNSDDAPIERVEGSDVRITFVNHSTFLIQTEGYNILTDPVFSERTSPVSFFGPKRVHQTGIAMSDLPKIDVIIISHDHYDHLDLDSIKTLIKRDNPNVYLGLGVGNRLPKSDKIIELDWWESTKIANNFKLWFLDVQHFSGRTLTDRNSTLWGGFLLEVNGKKIYFGGDSGYADHYKRTHAKFGPVDIAFLPIGAYAPREMFKEIHLNPEEAVLAHLELEADLSIGMHYGAFQLTAERREEPIEFLEVAKKNAGVDSSSFITLDVGKAYTYKRSSSRTSKSVKASHSSVE